MSILSESRTWVFFGVLAMVGIAALLYLDPFELNLFGSKQSPAIVKPAAPAKQLPAAPRAAEATPPVAPVPIAEPVSAVPVAVSKIRAPDVAIPTKVEAIRSTMKSVEMIPVSYKRTIRKSARPKNLDLRHCLKLETNAAIAKCAGE